MSLVKKIHDAHTHKTLQGLFHAAKLIIQESKDAREAPNYTYLQAATCYLDEKLDEHTKGFLMKVNQADAEIYVSPKGFRDLWEEENGYMQGIKILYFIKSLVHEFVHLIYGENSESLTDAKTIEILNGFDWSILSVNGGHTKETENKIIGIKKNAYLEKML